MRYLKFLAGVHAVLAPPTYLEIGVRRGNSLALARARSIGIDPDYDLKPEHLSLGAESALFRETSDDYFARKDPLEPFGGRPISLAFIDGMHLVEFALRDFINVERHAHWSSVVVFDDIFPRRAIEAARDRSTRAWAGTRTRSSASSSATVPTSSACAWTPSAPDCCSSWRSIRANWVLSERYDEIVAEAMVPDPQRVPSEILERRHSLDPQPPVPSGLSCRTCGSLAKLASPVSDEYGERFAGTFARVSSWSLQRLLPSPT